MRGLPDPDQRYQAYEQALAYRLNPERLAAIYAQQTLFIVDEISRAREKVSQVTISPDAKRIGLELIQQLKVDSMRAEITLFEAARAYAAADDREEVIPADIGAVASIALRLRHSEGLDDFHRSQNSEDERLAALYTGRLEALHVSDVEGSAE